MGGQVKDAVAASVSFEIVVQPFVFDDVGNVVSGESGEVAEFNEQAPQVSKYLPDDPLSLVVGQVGKRHAEVVHACFPLSPGEAIAGSRDDVADPVGNASRHRSEGSEQQFRQDILDELFSTHSHPCYFHILSR